MRVFGEEINYLGVTMRPILFVLLMAGCVSAEERERQAMREYQQEQWRQQQYRERVFAQCRSYGYQDGTEQFRACLMQVDMANRQASEQQRAIMLQQILQDESARQQRSMPLCSQFGPGMQGYMRAQGACR